MTADLLARIGIFGLGEAGSEIATGLVEAGITVRAYDPAPVATPPGVERHARPAPATHDVDCVLAITASGDADTALGQCLDDMTSGMLYADLSTSSPGAKRARATLAANHGIRFVDAALMATVPGKGIRTPQLASGPAATAYANALAGVGAPITVVDTEPGVASTHKLLRSVVTKGLGALMLESMEAGRAAGLESWLWAHLVETITHADEDLMVRLIDGNHHHAVRRHEEMQASAALLRELGTSSLMTSATEEAIRTFIGRRTQWQEDDGVVGPATDG